MKSKVYYLIIAILIAYSCKKEEINKTSLFSINVTNAVVDGRNVKLNTNLNDSAVNFNSKIFSLVAGDSKVEIYPTNDNSTYYYKNNLVAERNSVYSLFLCGTISNTEFVLVKDLLSSFYIDSSIGVRVVNLSANSDPINISLGSDSKNSIFYKVGYKEVSEFIKLPLPGSVSVSNVTFQVQNENNDKILASYTLPATSNNLYQNVSIMNSRFRNITLVIKGIYGVNTGQNAFGMFPVPNY